MIKRQESGKLKMLICVATFLLGLATILKATLLQDDISMCDGA